MKPAGLRKVLPRDGELVPATLELHADYSLIRDREEEETDFLHLTGKIEGRGKVVGNAEIEQPNANGQVSEYVWVPAFNDGVNWILTDVTNSIYGENSNPGGTVAQVSWQRFGRFPVVSIWI